ncbi:hypothetical protein BKA69DRAFT_1085077 [Paraphysoderma sedebokerense]|nr:hypothetical protein BKA69DRAFT_1085077 [Paraphysoderma sedebokerense]
MVMQTSLAEIEFEDGCTTMGYYVSDMIIVCCRQLEKYVQPSRARPMRCPAWSSFTSDSWWYFPGMQIGLLYTKEIFDMASTLSFDCNFLTRRFFLCHTSQYIPLRFNGDCEKYPYLRSFHLKSGSEDLSVTGFPVICVHEQQFGVFGTAVMCEDSFLLVFESSHMDVSKMVAGGSKEHMKPNERILTTTFSDRVQHTVETKKGTRPLTQMENIKDWSEFTQYYKYTDFKIGKVDDSCCLTMTIHPGYEGGWSSDYHVIGYITEPFDAEVIIGTTDKDNGVYLDYYSWIIKIADHYNQLKEDAVLQWTKVKEFAGFEFEF